MAAKSIGEKLPYIYEAVEAIISVSQSEFHGQRDRETKKRQCAINTYSKELVEKWEKTFGSRENVIVHVNTVKYRLRAQIKNYFLNVQDGPNKRLSIKEWRERHNELFDLLKDGIDITSLSPHEQRFYLQQKDTKRRGYITEDVDTEYEESFAHLDGLPNRTADSSDEDNDETIPESKPSNVMLTRSGSSLLTVPTNTVHTQTELQYVNPPPDIRGVRNCTDAVKECIVVVSTKCKISLECARVAVQCVCKHLYDHKVYRDKEEAIADCQDSNIEQLNTTENLGGGSAVKKIPVSAAELAIYKKILPSSRTCRDYKELLSSDQEQQAGVFLYDKDDKTKAILHIDFTSRAFIKGEWPSIILNFPHLRRFNLRPLYVAYEDRSNITLLLLETYKRLSVAASHVKGKEISAKELWEKTDDLMTDSVSKNMGVTDLISEKLETTYIPFHTLCKAHLTEGLDRSNIDTVGAIEQEVGVRKALESVNPSLKPFFRGEKCVAVAGIKCLCSLVAPEKSSKPSSLYDEFNFILEREKKSKHISLYKERRFTKLGATAAKLVDAHDQYMMLLSETNANNLHVQAAKLYMDSEFFWTCLAALAHFTYRVTLPLLNCVEVCNQEELIPLLVKLEEDLRSGDMSTLKDYMVVWRRVALPEITEVVKMMLDKMCKQASSVVKLQCGREYGIEDATSQPRATELHKLTPEQLRDLPTENCINERDLAHFSHIASVAKFGNKKFTAKEIRSNCTLYQAKSITKDTKTCHLSKKLRGMEKDWTAAQSVLATGKIEEKRAKGANHKNYICKLLAQCKSWNGPFTSAEEMDRILSIHGDIEEKIVRTELNYYKHTHKADVAARPELFKVNMVGHQERLENLLTLLTDDGNDATNPYTPSDLPSNQDALNILKSSSEPPLEAVPLPPVINVDVNELCVTVWENGWYLGYVLQISETSTYVDHLERVSATSDVL